MGCSHGWHGAHGCGPAYAGPHDRGWCDPGDWYEAADGPIRRPRRARRSDPEVDVEDLEARLEQLRESVRRVEAELESLRGPGTAGSG